MSVFSKKRLQNGRTKLEGSMPGEQDLWSSDHILELEHVPTGYKVKFPAYLENFSDAFTQQWNAEDVYGRMDPIAVFQGTRRALAMSWKVPASSAEQAKENMDIINVLMSFMYPLYRPGRGEGQEAENLGTVISMGPLMRVKFANLIHNSSQKGKGLMGYVNGFTVDITTEEGMFIDQISKAYYPKSVTLNFELNVLHEHSLGWEKSGDGDGATYVWRGGNQGFPYKTENIVPTRTKNSEAQGSSTGNNNRNSASKKVKKSKARKNIKKTGR
jgi:hypothetical protein